MIDDAKRLLSQLEVPWDELRQRRVLGKVEAKLAERKQARRRRPLLFAGGVAAGLLAAAAVAVAVIAAAPAPTPEPMQIAVDHAPPRVQPQPTIPDQSALTLPDGSLAQMHTGAQVAVDVQTDDLVRLVQRAGTVRYEVTPNPARRFVVDAEGVEVRVIGTVFSVALGDQHVTVAVERGRVEVEGADRVAELGAGDELKVPLPTDGPILIDDDVVIEVDPVTDDEGTRPRPKPVKPAATAKELLQRADQARLRGQMADAAAALGELVRRYPKDPLAYSSYFQLGKVERARGHHSAAASAFSACYKRAPSGALAEDARAEAAVSWMAAGKGERAATAAAGYLERYPGGAHRGRMQRIVDKAK